MRMGTLLFGGILGALAVVYANRNNSSMMAGLANAGQSMGGMVNKAKSKFSNMNMDSVTSNTHNSNTNLSKVEKIVNKDPELKHTVNEILADNKQTTASARMQ